MKKKRIKKSEIDEHALAEKAAQHYGLWDKEWGALGLFDHTAILIAIWCEDYFKHARFSIETIKPITILRRAIESRRCEAWMSGIVSEEDRASLAWMRTMVEADDMAKELRLELKANESQKKARRL